MTCNPELKTDASRTRDSDESACSGNARRAAAGLGVRELETPAWTPYRDETFVIPFSLLRGSAVYILQNIRSPLEMATVARRSAVQAAWPGPETTRAGPANCDAGAEETQ